MHRRDALAAVGAVALPTAAGCAATDPPTAEPSEGFAEFRLRLINERDYPVDAFVTIRSMDGAFEEELTVVGLAPGVTDDTREVAFPRDTYEVHSPATDPPSYTWHADRCAVLRLTLTFGTDDAAGETACLREWDDG